MLRATIAALLTLAMIPLGTASGGHDREGSLPVGTGNLKLSPGIDHVITFAPPGAIGFDRTGADVHYEYLAMFGGSGAYYRVIVLAPAGTHQVPWGLDWVMSGVADVPFVGVYGTDCTSLFCNSPPLP